MVYGANFQWGSKSVATDLIHRINIVLTCTNGYCNRFDRLLFLLTLYHYCYMCSWVHVL